jgi:hypothetical protein
MIEILTAEQSFAESRRAFRDTDAQVQAAYDAICQARILGWDHCKPPRPLNGFAIAYLVSKGYTVYGRDRGFLIDFLGSRRV